MPLDATRISQFKGHLIHDDILQFYNLLVGVMVDQPVEFGNDLSVDGVTRLYSNVQARSTLVVSGDFTVSRPAQTYLGGATVIDATLQVTGNTSIANPAVITGKGTVPAGGTAGQVLSKSSATDYALGWANAPAAANGLPTGGTAGQVLSKIDATNYNAQWVTPSAGVSWPLLAPDGSLSAPSYSFASNSGTGMYTNGVAISFATGGTIRANIGATFVVYEGLQFGTDNAYDIGSTISARPRNVYAATAFIGPGALPTGGTTGQVLSKVDGTNYNVQWTTPSSGLTLPLGQDLTFAPDGTYNIGAAAANRPANLYVTASATLGNFVAIGGAVNTSSALRIVDTATAGWSGTSQYALYINATTSSAAVSSVTGINVGYATQAAVANAYGVYINPTFAGTATLSYGLYVTDVGTSATTAYGVYIVAPAGSGTKIGLYNLGSSRLDGTVGISVAPSTSQALTISTSTLTGVSQFGILANPTFGSGATTFGIVARIWYQSAAATFTTGQGIGIQILGPTLGAGNTVSTMYGLYVANQGTSAITSAYGMYIAAQVNATSTNIGLRNDGTTYFANVVSIGLTPPYPGAALTIQQPTAMLTGINQWGLLLNGTFGSAATNQIAVIQASLATQAASFTCGFGYSINIPVPSLGAGSAITNLYGLYVGNQGSSSVTNAWGVYIMPQSGAATTNLGIYNGGTSQFMDRIGVNQPPNTAVLVSLKAQGITGTTYGYQYLNNAATANLFYTRDDGALYTLGPVWVNSTSNVLRAAPNNSAFFNIESWQGYMFLCSGSSTHLCHNAYYDGTQWQRMNVAAGAAFLTGSFSTPLVIQNVPAGGNPIGAWTPLAQMDSSGRMTFFAGGASSAGVLQFNYQAFMITCADSGSTQRPVLAWTGDNYVALYCGNAGLLFTNYTNNVRLGTLDNSGNMLLGGGNLYLINTTTAITSDGANLLLYATNGAVFTRASGIYAQSPAGAYVPINAGSYGFGNGPLITSAGGGPTIAYRTISPQAHSFEFTSGGYAPIYASAFTPASARRFKDNIHRFEDPLKIVLDDRVHAVNYTEKTTGCARVGFVADEWLPVLPDVVCLNDIGDVETLDYDRISAVTFEALKRFAIDTNARLEALEAKLAA